MSAPDSAGWFRRDGDLLLLELHVQPGAARTGGAGLHGGRLKVRVAARALEGAANGHLVAFIAATLGAARRDVTIAAGLNSRVKRVAVRGAKRGPEALLPRAGAGTRSQERRKRVSSG